MLNPLIYEQKILFNCRSKFYIDIDGKPVQYQKIVFSEPIFNPLKSKDNNTRYDILQEKVYNLSAEINPTEKNIQRALRRAKSRLFDLLINNIADCNFFVTLTIDKEVCDRYNYKAIIDNLNVYLNNKVQKNGLKYILVPELHKDGAIHFHGVFNNFKGINLSDSGHRKNGKKIYNISSYKLGYTTAQRITGKDSVVKVSKYIYKYIGKQAEGNIGGRYYLHGGKLNEPLIEYSDEDFAAFAPGEFFVTPSLACKVEKI